MVEDVEQCLPGPGDGLKVHSARVVFLLLFFFFKRQGKYKIERFPATYRKVAGNLGAALFMCERVAKDRTDMLKMVVDDCRIEALM